MSRSTDANTKRETGKKAQLSNIQAAKVRNIISSQPLIQAPPPPPQAIADVIRTCLGPRAMLKMLMDPMGGIVMTNDGNAILREVGLLLW